MPAPEVEAMGEHPLMSYTPARRYARAKRRPRSRARKLRGRTSTLFDAEVSDSFRSSHPACRAAGEAVIHLP